MEVGSITDQKSSENGSDVLDCNIVYPVIANEASV